MSGHDEALRSDDPRVLRAEIERLGREHAEAVARLRGEIEALRGGGRTGRDVEEATGRLALQQDVDTLRQTLREKERVIDVTAAQCRRLEDELEDQYLAYDGLKQDLDRKKLSLAAAREQTVRLSQERQEIEERYQALLEQRGGRTEQPRETLPAPVAMPAAPSAQLFGAFAVGALVAGLIAVVFVGRTPEAPVPPQAPATAAEPEQVPALAQPNEASPGEPSPTLEAVGGPRTEPEVLRTVRDRLRDGSLGPLMLAVKGGRFMMGKVAALPNDDRGPPREVTLAGFLAGATEVTFEEYDRFVRATGGRFPNDFGWGRGRRPVVDVSWSEAVDYTRWLSVQTGQRYRLLTEAEWEYVAAAGAAGPYWWGYRVEPERAVCFDCGTLWDNRSTAPAGTFDPNPLGLYDTAGNAMEWVADCYYPNYIGAPTDGSARVEEGCPSRVARGGAFNKPASSMKTTERHRFAPDTRLNMLGFRLGRDE